MSVKVHYLCAFGNNLFQYAIARLFAEHHGLKLLSDFVPQETPYSKGNHARDVLGMSPAKDGLSVKSPEIEVNDATPWDLFGDDVKKASYTFKGLFQKTRWYTDRMDKIKGFTRTDAVTEAHPDDIVINLRIGVDYRQAKFTLHNKWYMDILKREKFRKLHIVSDEIDPDYIGPFMEYNPTVVSLGAKEDFNYIRKFKKIVCANSTFSWWAAFFSNASMIYTHKRWIQEARTGRPGLLVFDPFKNGVAVDGPFLEEA